ncbi:MAG: hypothetical protein LBK95_17690 [Bifidobacteriaceae bacterium]|nr:hypothetical protein [Bifidobacteriaceae bacterium]
MGAHVPEVTAFSDQFNDQPPTNLAVGANEFEEGHGAAFDLMDAVED